MKIIGISGLYNSVAYKQARFPALDRRAYRITQGFDAAAALLDGPDIGCAAAEERFTREKTTGAFPVNSINFCLQTAGLGIGDIDYVAHNFDYQPYEDYYRDSDLGGDIYDKVFSRDVQLAQLEEHFPGQPWDEKFVQLPHHLTHAASSFYVSGFEESLIVVADGMAEQQSVTVAVGTGDDIEIIKQIPSIHSLGILYGVFTLYLGFAFNMDEYKVMGLAPYGDPKRFYDKIMGLIDLKDDGTHAIPVLFQNKTELEKETYAGTLAKLTELFGPAREPESELTQDHRDIAAALQSALLTTVTHLLKTFRASTGLKDLCMAGGVALNCTANGAIKRSRQFRRMFVQPASGDDGTALGAALYLQRQKNPGGTNTRMALPLWGPDYDRAAIEDAIASRPECSAVHFDDFTVLAKEAARLMSEGKILSCFQGRMEFGPRALGNRSILADPRPSDMRERINLLVKKREDFRPFAPAVIAEEAARYFAVDRNDEATYAYMLFVTHVRAEYREQLPAITHVDGSARLQTVDRAQNERFWTLLSEFGKLSGMPVLLNTSFNVRGQPIVCNPKEAVDTFLDAGLDGLLIGNHLVLRT